VHHYLITNIFFDKVLVNNITQARIQELPKGAGQGGRARNCTDTIVAAKKAKGAVAPKVLDHCLCRRVVVNRFDYISTGHFAAIQLGTAGPRTRTALNVLPNLDRVPNYN
jgi:hypothetical protein